MMAKKKVVKKKTNSRSTKKSKATEQPRELIFHFIKTQDFRTIHVDGAWGGLSTQGEYIHMAVYSERYPLPQQMKHEVYQDGRVGKEIKRLGREGVIRDVHADLVFDIRTAETIRTWLDSKIKNHKKMERELKK